MNGAEHSLEYDLSHFREWVTVGITDVPSDDFSTKHITVQLNDGLFVHDGTFTQGGSE